MDRRYFYNAVPNTEPKPPPLNFSMLITRPLWILTPKTNKLLPENIDSLVGVISHSSVMANSSIRRPANRSLVCKYLYGKSTCSPNSRLDASPDTYPASLFNWRSSSSVKGPSSGSCRSSQDLEALLMREATGFRIFRIEDVATLTLTQFREAAQKVMDLKPATILLLACPQRNILKNGLNHFFKD